MKRVGLAFLLVALYVSAAFAAPVGPINEVYAENGMVSAAHELASQAGVEIMKKGGNAIDGAVATALALNVVEPYNCGIGGGGFMMIRFAKTGEIVFLDYREKAPAASTKDMYASEQAQKDKWSLYGGKAVGVPGFLMGMWQALEKYGTMSFAEVAAPAIRLAEEGFELRKNQQEQLEEAYPFLLKYAEAETIPYVKDGLPLVAGEVMKQPKLAATFRLIAKEGPKVFYDGKVGEALVAAVQRNGGIMTMDDLRSYKTEFRTPVEGTYRNYKIYSSPPASSGGTHIIQLLNIMENFDPSTVKHNSPEYLNRFGQAMRFVFADRAKYMGDTAFVQVPLQGLLSKEYAKTIFNQIKTDGKIMKVGVPGDPWKFNGAPKAEYKAGMGNEFRSTTHFSAIDKEGNIVASTNSINLWFGSRVTVPEYQFTLNNQMDDFSSDPTSTNAPEPGKRPLSSMSPTIILDAEGKPFMTLGAAGALRILVGVTQVIMNVIDYNMGMDEAIQQPRMWTGVSGPSRLDKALGEDILKRLEELGYEIDKTSDSSNINLCQGILLRNGKINGGAETNRSTGMAVGF